MFTLLRKTQKKISRIKMSAEQGSRPWKEGFWYSKDNPTKFGLLKGNEIQMKNLAALDYPNEVQSHQTITLTFGDFGETSKEIKEATGVEKYNVEMVLFGFKFQSVLNASGTQLTTWGFTNSLEVTNWISEDDLDKLKVDREPFEAPSSPYEKRAKGKMYWISGPPGAGKSTTSQLLARKKDFIYFEADACLIFANPFVDTNAENPSIACFKQKPLKGVPKDMIQAASDSRQVFREMQKGKVEDMDQRLKPMVNSMAGMIKQQRERLGGTWSIAQAIPTRKLRDFLREQLGPDLIFIVLNLTKDCILQRLESRHGTKSGGFDQLISKFYDNYQPAEEDEINAFNIDISNEMTPKDVVEKVIALIESNK